jgi:8-oxo-dGTP pyrophosphatase MutT (NUDIX family)
VSPPVLRTGARMLIIDPEDRVLLIEEAWSEGPGTPWRHWLTPGGGVEAGESLPLAATREVIEETGLRIELPADASPVLVHQRQWSWEDVVYDQTDHYFAARVGRAFLAVPAAATVMEVQTVVGSRWWSVAELRASPAVFVPPMIADVLTGLLAADSLPHPQARIAGRVLVLDPSGRVLLLHTRAGADSERINWVAPGGGVEGDESVLAAAARELFEETGIVAAFPPDATVAAVERAVFAIGDWHLDQTDHYVVHRVEAQLTDLDRSRWTQIEQDTVLGWRWWSADELRATSERFWPADLPDVLDRVDRVDRRPA